MHINRETGNVILDYSTYIFLFEFLLAVIQNNLFWKNFNSGVPIFVTPQSCADNKLQWEQKDLYSIERPSSSSAEQIESVARKPPVTDVHLFHIQLKQILATSRSEVRSNCTQGVSQLLYVLHNETLDIVLRTIQDRNQMQKQKTNGVVPHLLILQDCIKLFVLQNIEYQQPIFIRFVNL